MGFRPLSMIDPESRLIYKIVILIKIGSISSPKMTVQTHPMKYLNFFKGKNSREFQLFRSNARDGVYLRDKSRAAEMGLLLTSPLMFVSFVRCVWIWIALIGQ